MYEHLNEINMTVHALHMSIMANKYSTLPNTRHGPNSRHGTIFFQNLIKNMDQIKGFY